MMSGRQPHLPYRKRQTGKLLILALGLPIVLLVVVSFQTGFHPIILALLPLFLLLLLAFHSLTVEVSHQELRWSFGVGLISKSVPVNEVQNCQVVTTPWYYGWGIRWTPYGWLYNVSGRHSVQVSLRSGRTFRIGSAQPERLLAALQAARSR